MKKICWIDPETGDLLITIPAYNDLARSKDLSDDEFCEWVQTLAVPEGVSSRIIDDSDPAISSFLSDRTFRDAWTDDGTSLQIDLPKAQVIHMGRIRDMRNKELTALDVPFMKALEDGDTDVQATIKAKKQALRDIPQTFDLTTDTPEQLKEKWPEGLPKE